MKKSDTNKPMVTSVSSFIKKTTHFNGESVTSKEDTCRRKRGFLEMLDEIGIQVAKQIKDGKIELTNTMDIERLIKLTLLVSGEADTIKGKVGSSESEIGVDTSAKLSMSQVESILSLEDPEVVAMYEKLYKGYNELNDQKG